MKNKVKLGIFFIITLIIFVGAIILLGKIKLKGDGYRLYVDYVFIGDLQENGKVSYRGGGIQIGFIARTLRGRQVLPPAYKHLGYEYLG